MSRGIRAQATRVSVLPPHGSAPRRPIPLTVATDQLLSVSGLSKAYRRGKNEVPVLKGVDLSIETGRFTAIVGKSGSGKSTLLHLLGALDSPDSGEIWFRDERLDQWPTWRKDEFRNRRVGMIFQFYHLLPELNAVENVLVPRMIRHGVFSYWRHRRAYVVRARELLELVGLSHRLTHKPNQLSGGEMQRVAIARALISEPDLLLADEPTGNLDTDSGREVIESLLKLKRQHNVTIAMVTHDENIASTADRVVALVDGRIQVRR
jgi:lipoprotein-releasing system ATP-binding protein